MSCRLPAEWSAAGARLDRDGLLYLNEWRRGFTVHELRSLFFKCQEVRSLNARIRVLERDLAAAGAAADELQRRCAFYRKNLVIESQLGLALSRIAS